MFFLVHQSCVSSCLPWTAETFPFLYLRAFEQEAMGTSISHPIKKKYRRKGVGSSLSSALDTFWIYLPATHQSSLTDFLTKPESYAGCSSEPLLFLSFPPIWNISPFSFILAAVLLRASHIGVIFPFSKLSETPSYIAFPAPLVVLPKLISPTPL